MNSEKRILITGANGFLGRQLISNLKDHIIIDMDLDNASIVGDLSGSIPQLPQESCDVVIHCAGKAHVVPKSKQEEDAFFQVNVEGTKNLCRALEQNGSYPKCFVFISSVSVYGLEFGKNIKESASLNGKTPYAISKIKAEQFVRNWCLKNGINYLILRLPLIVGDNPPGNLGNMINAIRRNRFFLIDKGRARKSMVVAKDLAHLIFANIDNSGIYNITDRHHPSFKELDNVLTTKFNRKSSPSIPRGLGKLFSVFFGIFPFSPLNYVVFKKMTRDLTFNDDLAVVELNWSPSNSLKVLAKIKLKNE